MCMQSRIASSPPRKTKVKSIKVTDAHGWRVGRLAFLVFLSGLSFTALQAAAPLRSISVAKEVPVTIPQGAEPGLLGTVIGGAAGQIVTEIERANARHAPKLPHGDFGTPDSIRTAVSDELRRKGLLATGGKPDAELRLRIMQCGLVPPRGAVFSKNVTPILAVQAVLVNEAGKIIWEDRRQIFGGDAPKFSKDQVVANPRLVNAAMEKMAQRIARQIVQALVTPGTGHQWDAIRRDYDPLPGSRAKKNK